MWRGTIVVVLNSWDPNTPYFDTRILSPVLSTITCLTVRNRRRWYSTKAVTEIRNGSKFMKIGEDRNMSMESTKPAVKHTLRIMNYLDLSVLYTSWPLKCSDSLFLLILIMAVSFACFLDANCVVMQDRAPLKILSMTILLMPVINNKEYSINYSHILYHNNELNCLSATSLNIPPVI